MNFDEILNATIAGLICSFIVATSTVLLKILKKSYNKDSIMFWYNISFYFDIFATIYNAIHFKLDTFSLFPLSFGNNENLIFFIVLVVCFICTLIQYSNIKKYIKQTN